MGDTEKPEGSLADTASHNASAVLGVTMNEPKEVPATYEATSESPAKKGWRFWAVFGSLCMATWLVAVETTVVSTALPSITHEINAGDSYVWVFNVYLLTR